jgi:hypothetical protein
MFNIIKYCQQKQQCNCVTNNKLATSFNDPTLSTRMRYAQYIRTTKPNKCC